MSANKLLAHFEDYSELLMTHACVLIHFSHAIYGLCDPTDCVILLPTTLLYPWESPGKNIGVGCCALLSDDTKPQQIQ